MVSVIVSDLVRAYGMDPKLSGSRDDISLSLCSIYIFSVFPSDRNNSGSKNLKEGRWSYSSGPCLSFQVPSPNCSPFWLRSTLLSPGSLSHPRSLRLSRGCLCVGPARPPPRQDPPTSLQLHISIHSPGPLGFSPVSPHI